jgi:predicted alpha-1,2-mannosidase
MRNKLFIFLSSFVFCLLICLEANAASELSLTQFVNPFIGTDPNAKIREGYGWDTGNVFPGAVCPRGMLAWSPDTTHKKQIAGGYWYPDNVIEDFSVTHFSGRGVVCLMDFPFMPVAQEVDVSPGKNWGQFTATFSHTNESASAGYYSVKLDNGIETELTATPRSGMARFTFPQDKPARLLIRTDGSLSIHKNEVTGVYNDKIGGGKRDFNLYLVAEFDRPFEKVETWEDNKVRNKTETSGTNCGVILAFDCSTNAVVQVRVGISYISVENAEENLKQENPSWDFSGVRQKADTMWNNVMNHIQVEGGTSEQKQSFYTALYHCFMHPNLLDDVNGQYPGMDGKIHSVAAGYHQYQNIPAWDEYRSLATLISILVPSEMSDIAQSLVNYAQQDAAVRAEGGGLPRWEQVNRNSAGMVGDGDDVMLASAYAYGANQFDAHGALVAMDKGASQPGTTSDDFEVRKGLDEYLKLGYVPNIVSVNLEYENADFALAQFAKELGDHEKYVTYQNRAQNWEKLYDDSTGLLHPKDADGTWAGDFSPTTKKGFVEGTAAQYVWMVNFNLHGLIDKMGGDEKAIAKLDYFFSNVNGGVDADTAFMGNEPCEETPWVYDFAGAPAKTQQVVRRIQDELFTSLPSGLPGNDDAGALSSWYIFSALGIYPEIPGVPGFVVGSPMFTKATIQRDNGQVIQIIGKSASPDNFYVQKLTVNGKDWNSLWIPWSELSDGGTLHFKLGNKPSSWGKNSPPPSFGTIKQ